MCPLPMGTVQTVLVGHKDFNRASVTKEEPRPIKETSRLWRNGSGQYETTAGFCFREGSPIEVLVPDKYHLDSSHWERTFLRYDGKDYYLANYADLPLKGLAVRVREGDQP